ncbi:MAG: hypothetical protein GYA47_12235 [Desulfovibrio sp.]|nr:hypothetical protein [Desulfovibrio sp.]
MSGHETGAGPRVTFAVASATGDIPFDQGLRDVPLEGCPLSTTYGEYFDGLRDFVLGPGLPALVGELARQTKRPVSEGELAAIVIKAQKHGALYHPASVQVTGPAGSATLGVNVAAGPHGWAALAREHKVLARLSRDVPDAGLPRPLCFHEGDRLDFLMVNWFSGFHEFHVGSDGRIVLWDYEDGGLIPLEIPMAREVYRQSARILTLCYDPVTGDRVWPWRHAAGDFVASLAGGRVRTRLITARGYGAPAGVTMNMLGALRHFLLTTTLYMRLDRLDGVGERKFLPAWCLEAAVEGILETFVEHSDIRERLPGAGEAVRALSPEAWRDVLAADPDFAADPDAEFLLSRLDGHLADLVCILSA